MAKDGLPGRRADHYGVAVEPPEEIDGIVIKTAGTTGFVVVGIIADVSAVVLLAISEDVHDAAAANPLAMIALTGFVALIAVILLNMYSRAGSATIAKDRAMITAVRAKELELQVAVSSRDARILELEGQLAGPAVADMARWAEFLTDFGRDSLLYIWLTEHFYVAYAWEREVRELDRINNKWSREPSRFYDEEIEQAFQTLRVALLGLDEATGRYYWYDRDPEAEIGKRRLILPGEWDYQKKDEAVAAIQGSWNEVMEAHKEFFRIAHSKRLVSSNPT
jgi:hypothetical protein